MKVLYRHISNPTEEKVYDTVAAYTKLPSLFRDGRSQSQFDSYELRHFEEDFLKGIILEYSVIEDKPNE